MKTKSMVPEALEEKLKLQVNNKNFDLFNQLKDIYDLDVNDYIIPDPDAIIYSIELQVMTNIAAISGKTEQEVRDWIIAYLQDPYTKEYMEECLYERTDSIDPDYVQEYNYDDNYVDKYEKMSVTLLVK